MSVQLFFTDQVLRSCRGHDPGQAVAVRCLLAGSMRDSAQKGRMEKDRRVLFSSCPRLAPMQRERIAPSRYVLRANCNISVFRCVGCVFDSDTLKPNKHFVEKRIKKLEDVEGTF